MTVEIPVRDKYLHHQVKKVSPPKGGNSGSSKDKRYKGPKLTYGPKPTRVRVKVLDGRTGRIRWIWR